MAEWYEEWFGEEYLQLYPHRDDADADRLVALILASVPFAPGWRVLDVACGAGRHARAFRAAGARCFGLDLSASLLRIARGVTDAPLIRADMRYLPVRPASMELTVNLFTSFGYFEHDVEHARALGEMVTTVRPGGWFVIDLLNPSAVKSGLVPQETIKTTTATANVTRTLSADHRSVCKAIQWSNGKRFVERVRLFEPDEIADMLAQAGVSVEHRFGDYDGHAMTPSSARTILVGRAE
ncbi:MAG TPA: methyltransferase domain-containing protein [Gemmatimonadales bacterium]|jgi:SAM-dependent methyltransferase